MFHIGNRVHSSVSIPCITMIWLIQTLTLFSYKKKKVKFCTDFNVTQQQHIFNKKQGYIFCQKIISPPHKIWDHFPPIFLRYWTAAHNNRGCDGGGVEIAPTKILTQLSFKIPKFWTFFLFSLFFSFLPFSPRFSPLHFIFIFPCTGKGSPWGGAGGGKNDRICTSDQKVMS